MGLSIDKASMLPLYYQLKEIIRQEIEGGILRPGNFLLPERELCEKYGVSRATVRQAVLDLVREGLLERRQGKGTIIAPSKVEEDLLGFFNFSEQMKLKGKVPSAKMINIESLEPSQRFCNLFSLNEGEKIARIIRLRLINNEPLFVEKTFLPGALYLNLNEEQFAQAPALYNLITQSGKLTITRVKKFIEPTLIDDFESSLLEVKKGTPALLLERIIYTEEECAIAVSNWIVRGDRCRHFIDVDEPAQ